MNNVPTEPPMGYSSAVADVDQVAAAEIGAVSLDVHEEAAAEFLHGLSHRNFVAQ